MAFDWLYARGKDLRKRALRVLRNVLEEIVDGQHLVLPARRLTDNGLEAWAQVRERGYEGLVGKDEASAYVEGRTLSWLKVKQPHYRDPAERRGARARGRAVTAIEALCEILDAGGKVMPGPERPRLLAPPRMRPLVDAHREGLRALLDAYGHCNADIFRRARAFKQQIAEWTASGRWAVPVLVLPESQEPNAGRCISCGCSIEEGWRCSTCRSAIDAAFDMSRSERG